MTTITRDKPKGFLAPDMHDQFAAELTAKTGVVCQGTVVNNTPAADPVNNDRLDIVFDGDPVEATVDAAIAAFPSLPEAIGDQFAADANVPTHTKIIPLNPGEHVGLRVTMAVSLAGQGISSDGILVGLVPVWREPGGAVAIERATMQTASRVPSIAISLSAFELDNATVGVAISYTQRASGTVRLLHLEVEEIYRKVLS